MCSKLAVAAIVSALIADLQVECNLFVSGTLPHWHTFAIVCSGAGAQLPCPTGVRSWNIWNTPWHFWSCCWGIQGGIFFYTWSYYCRRRKNPARPSGHRGKNANKHASGSHKWVNSVSHFHQLYGEHNVKHNVHCLGNASIVHCWSVICTRQDA